MNSKVKNQLYAIIAMLAGFATMAIITGDARIRVMFFGWLVIVAFYLVVAYFLGLLDAK